ncbi:hypothetical protein C0J50_9563 [Silurus asotus]|uniref:TNFR-Cys domain-containing protein n=1 Tax=Silurus asotus TaxID=30991 RepID=A0AAD5F959_SILAS|nr:hypothetical protein C0J50_9563 [Silurus asotus]
MYECELPSGQRILCDRCPPGSCMQNNCTETQPTECRQRNEASTNRVCACKEGFYSNSGVCRLCPHGFGVKEKGTPHKDTAGEPGNTRCVQNTVCKSEEKLQIHGSNCLDNVCVTCKKIIHQGIIDVESRDSKLGLRINYLLNNKSAKVIRCKRYYKLFFCSISVFRLGKPHLPVLSRNLEDAQQPGATRVC